MRSSTPPGSKLRISTTSAPFMKAMSGVTLSPPMWKSGAQTRVMSSTLMSKARPALMLFQSRLAWVSIAPLGRPVVPDVYMITATSSVATWLSRSSSRWSRSRSSSRRTPGRSLLQTSSRQGMRSRISSTTAANASSWTRVCTPASAMMKASSGGVSRKLRGTKMAPSFAAAKRVRKKSGWLRSR